MEFHIIKVLNGKEKVNTIVPDHYFKALKLIPLKAIQRLRIEENATWYLSETPKKKREKNEIKKSGPISSI